MAFVKGDPVLVDINGVKVLGIFQAAYYEETLRRYEVLFPFGLLSNIPSNLVEPAPKPVAVGDVIANHTEALRMPVWTLFVENDGDYGQVTYTYKNERASFTYIGAEEEYSHNNLDVIYPLTVLWVPPTNA